MSTFLFDSIIFGPVKSRRLGVSLGINLIPVNTKICNFDCIYCECGWTDNEKLKTTSWPTFEVFSTALENKLNSMKKEHQHFDVITFAGNGEPTMHPLFPEIIDETIRIRNRIFPKTRIAVLTNGTKIENRHIFKALLKVDDNIIKLDSGNEKTIRLLNKPYRNMDMDEYIYQLQKFRGACIIQALFVKGSHNNYFVDNTTNEEIEQWIDCIKKIQPKAVQICTFERDTASPYMKRTDYETLKRIALKVQALGIPVQIFR